MTSSIAMCAVYNQLNGRLWRPVGSYFSVDGTGYPGAPFPNPPPGAGFASAIAYGLMEVADCMWLWEGIGYPAGVTEMGSSVEIGRVNLVDSIQATPVGWPFVIGGYSQGAIVTDTVWTQDILASDGVLHNRLHDIKAIFNYGDPLRSPGIAYGNELAGIPLPKTLDGVVTGGIAGPADLSPAQTPAPGNTDGLPPLFSTALDGDIYGAAPVGPNPWQDEADAGKVGTTIYDLIQHFTLGGIIDVIGDLFIPIGMVEEIINGIQFAAAGMNAPHWQYGPYIGAAVNYMVNLGQELAAAA